MVGRLFRNIYTWGALLLWFFMPVTQGFATPVPWEITADSLIHLKAPEGILAEGNVILSRPKEKDPGGMVIRADWVRYDVERGTVKARGNVYVLSNQDEVRAKHADLDLSGKVGTFYDSTIFLAETHMYIQGEEVVKTGEFIYNLKQGWASSCRIEEGKPAPWAFRSKKAKLTIDGMAQLQHVTFHVKDKPVLYSPYLSFPAKTKRESGFLFPEWSHSSRSGFGLVAPYFVNLSPSNDLTLYPGYLERRGATYGAEYRYVLSGKSYGTLFFSGLQDDMVDGEDLREEYKSDGSLRRTKNRYWLRGKADHAFKNGWTGKADIDFVSDQDYLQEFQDGYLGYDLAEKIFLKDFGRGLEEETDNERESSLQLAKSWSDMVLTAELRTRQNVANDITLGSDDGDNVLEDGEFSYVARTVSPLQALPRVEFNGRRPLWDDSSLSVAWDTEYVNYWRDQGIGAHRIDLHPQLITSLPRGGWIEGKVTGGMRETYYLVESYGGSTWNHGDTQDRLAYDFTGNMATTLMRDFDFHVGSIDWLEHTVRPNLIYEYLTRSQDQEIRQLAFDGEDALDMKNWLTFELNNYFGVGGVAEGETMWNRDLGKFKILQTYAVNDMGGKMIVADKRREWSDLRFDLELYPLEAWKIRYQTNLSWYGQGITRNEVLNQLTTAKGHRLELDYQYKRYSGMAEPYFYVDSGDMVHDIEGRILYKISPTLEARAFLNKSFSTNHTVEQSVGLTYKPHCWMVEMDATKSNDDQRLMVIFSLDGIGRAFRWGKGNV